jgi:hypothetical protein
MNPEDILRDYERLMAAQPSSLSSIFDVTTVVLDNNGVRIVLSRTDNGVRMDVEMTIPERVSGDSTTEQCRGAALRTITLLEYLVNLVDNGFSLSLIDTEFLWTATIVFLEPPSKSILELLHPP